jgi:hypothetical protein
MVAVTIRFTAKTEGECQSMVIKEKKYVFVLEQILSSSLWQELAIRHV